MNDEGNQEAWNSPTAPSFSLGGDELGQGSERVTAVLWGTSISCYVLAEPTGGRAPLRTHHSWLLEVWGSGSPCSTKFPNVVISLSLLFVLINLRHFRRAILIRNKCKDICGDHKRPDLCRLNEVTYTTPYEIIVYCIKSCFGKYNRGSKLEWNEHGLRGEKCQFYGALKYLCSKLAFFGDLLSVARTRKLF